MIRRGIRHGTATVGLRSLAATSLQPIPRSHQSNPAVALTFVRYNSRVPPTPPPPGAPIPPGKSDNSPHLGASQDPHHDERTYGEKLKAAAKTPTRWYPIPIALGALVLLAVQFRKELTGGGPGSETLEVTSQGEQGAVLRRRNVDGPWQVRVYGALPLRSASQLWGYLNELVLPVWFRPMGFRFYGWIFGCDLSEAEEQDLTKFESLGEFFYRTLKDGVRPIADAPMVSPADGRVLHFGEITGQRVEQVKGITYSLDALLGQEGQEIGEKAEIQRRAESRVQMVDDENFATINDIPYSLDKLMGSGQETKEEKATRKRWSRWGIGGEGWKWWKRIGKSNKDKKGEDGTAAAAAKVEGGDAASVAGSSDSTKSRGWSSYFRRSKSSGNVSSMAADETDTKKTTTVHEHSATGSTTGSTSGNGNGIGNGQEVDASHPMSSADVKHDASVAISLGSSALSSVTSRGQDAKVIHPANRLYFMVVYLAPGDYHRFHSPTAWVVERRRHFTGDLFSVSPYIANRLSDLFVLNERVALLGRWKYGFYSMVPVGATNVGSIRINFDENLRTNTRKLSHPAHTFTEAVYTSASPILQGQPLLAGEEMGGFRLGSTIVMVFEAPKNWKFTVQAGDKVKVGQELGRFETEEQAEIKGKSQPR